jgi:hypothetical protein
MSIRRGGAPLRVCTVARMAVLGAAGRASDAEKGSGLWSDGSSATRTGDNFDLNELELLAGTPLGKHLSFFPQYDLFETEIERPTGPGEANETGTHKNITFETGGPRVPGMAKLL